MINFSTLYHWYIILLESYIKSCNNIKFIPSTVWGIKKSSKRVKIFEYLKNKVGSNGVLYLQETHSREKDENKWNDEFKGPLFFLHGTTNFCKVAMGYSGAKYFILEERKRAKMVEFYFLTLQQMNKIVYWLIYLMLTQKKVNLVRC